VTRAQSGKEGGDAKEKKTKLDASLFRPLDLNVALILCFPDPYDILAMEKTKKKKTKEQRRS
jgi:hypothetical protein